MQIINDTKFPIKIWATDLDPEAENQIRNIANLPFIHHHVAVMADAHVGKGSTVGTVIATKGAIIPAAVGVDIGCGMSAVQLPFKIDLLGDSLHALRASIERSIPVGYESNRKLTESAVTAYQNLLNSYSGNRELLSENTALQLGSLGGGNHFIEICADQENHAWVVLHSGSRNIGKTLAEVHIHKAKNLMRKHLIELPDLDLAYFAQTTLEFTAYLNDLIWAQNYAQANRNEMMLRVLKDVAYHVYGEYKPPEFMSVFRVDCHHNYSQLENHFGKNIWVTRKGAVSARKDQYGIVPGSMGTHTYIVKGKGNPESFCSCSHGAGRRMSRSKARQIYTLEDLKQQTYGVECRKDTRVIDEIPDAYKDIEEVMQNQEDLVDIAYQLKQLICIKG